MRCCLFLLVLVAATAAIHQPPKQRAADKDLLKKQQDVLYLVQQIMEEIPNEELRKIGQEYNIEGNLQQYNEPNLVQFFASKVRLGYCQPKGQAYTGAASYLRKEISLLTRTFLACKDYPTFLKTAAWARTNLNEHQFIKAFTFAVLQREDTQGIILPAPYEVFPHYFFDSRIIQKAQNLRSRGMENPLNEKTCLIPANCTAWQPMPEGRLAYFTQDIGLSTYYTYFSLAGWMHPETQQSSTNQQQPEENCEKCIGRGSQYYYLHQQLLARYHLERLSNELGPIRGSSYSNVQAPFKPYLRYLNGLEFPGRPDNLALRPHHEELVKTVWTLERRLRDAIDSGYVLTPQGQFLSLYEPQGLDLIGELIEETGRSINPRYYGNLQGAARQLLGGAPMSCNLENQTPAALEINPTAVRDPAFYQLYKRIMKIFRQYQESLPAYQQDDLILPGVQIESFTIDKLETYFDKFNVDLQSATISPQNRQQQSNLKIKAEVERLNHKPFEYKIVVQSEKQVDNAVVRIYLGPKFDYFGSPIHIHRDRMHFVELDQFTWNIKDGKNTIVRNSRQAPGRSGDNPSAQEIMQCVDEAMRSQQPFYITEPEQIFGFPERLALPKGTRRGMPLQLLVVISPPQQKRAMSYGPVLSQQFQNYQPQTYQLVQGAEYEQLMQRTAKGPFQQFEVVHEGSEEGRQQGRQISSSQWFFGQNPTSQESNQQQQQQRQQQRQQQQQWDQEQQQKRQQQQQQGSGEQAQQGQESQQSTERQEGQFTQGQSQRNWFGQGEEYQYTRQGQQQGDQSMAQYFQNKSMREIIGGAISLDGRPLGFPLERPLSPKAFNIPNAKIIDVRVFHREECFDEFGDQC